MGREIERKFLIDAAKWERPAECTRIVQGYLVREPGMTLRVRLAGGRAFLTLKGASHGFSRSEFEYPVPPSDAEAMLKEFAATALVRKVRYFCRYGGHLWEVDVFEGGNAGLIVAEIELGSEEEHFDRPPWLGREVTGDHRYSNSALAVNPYCRWRSDGDAG